MKGRSKTKARLRRRTRDGGEEEGGGGGGSRIKDSGCLSEISKEVLTILYFSGCYERVLLLEV